MLNGGFDRVVRQCRRSDFDAKRLVREMQLYGDEKLCAEMREQFNGKLCETVDDRRKTNSEARHALCDLWEGGALDNKTLLWAILVAEKYHETFALMIAEEIAEVFINDLIPDDDEMAKIAKRERSLMAECIEQYSNNYGIMKLLRNKIQTGSTSSPHREKHVTVGGIWPDNGVTFPRNDVEVGLRKEIAALCKGPRGALVVCGESGVGKTTLVTHVLREGEFLQNECGAIEVLLWLNVCELSTSPRFEEATFYSGLINLFSSFGIIDRSTEPSLLALQKALNESRPKLLLVLDDVFCPGVLAAMWHLTRNGIIRCIAIARNYQRASIKSDQFKCKPFLVEKMADELLQRMLRDHYGLDQSLENGQIERITKMCHGLPLIASVMSSQFDSKFSQGDAEKVYDNLLRNARKTVKIQAKPNDTLLSLLRYSSQLRYEKFRDDYYTLLVFYPGSTIEADDLAVIWKCELDDAIRRCKTAIDASLLCGNQSNGNSATSYVVHGLLHKAALDRALKDYSVSSEHELREKLLLRCCLQPGRNSLLLAIFAKRMKLLQILCKYIEARQLAQLALEWDAKDGSPLYQLAAIKATEMFCRLSEVAAGEDFEATMESFRRSRNGKTVFDLLASTINGKGCENVFLVGAKFGCHKLMEVLLAEETMKKLATSVDADDNNALIIAASNNHPKIVKILVESELFDVNAQNKRGETALMKCVRLANCLDTVKALCASKSIDVNLVDLDGDTALILAAENGRIDAVRYLVTEQKADIGIVNKRNGANSLEMAIALYCHVEMGRFLIGQGAGMAEGWWQQAVQNAARKGEEQFVNVLYEEKDRLLRNTASPSELKIEGKTKLLQTAARNGQVETIEQLIREGVNINGADQFGQTPLMFACQEGHVQVAKTLLEHGAAVNAQSHTGRTALMAACHQGHLEVIELLLDHGATIDIQSHTGWSALMAACDNGHYETARLLVTRGANIHLRKETGWTAFMFACDKGYLEIANFLLDRGAVIDLQSRTGRTSLMSSCQHGKLEVASFLLDEGASIDIQDHAGLTALIYACQEGHVNLIELLLDKGASIDAQDLTGRTGLMCASESGQLELVKLLLNRGSNIDAQGQAGSSALVHACAEGHLELAELLLDRGATIDFRNATGPTALMAASQKGHIEIALLLINRGADIDAQDMAGFTALMYASAEGHFEVAKMLTDRGVNINGQNQTGRTALMIASKTGCLEIVKLLVDRRANVVLDDKQGSDALTVASLEGHFKVVNFLLERGATLHFQAGYALFHSYIRAFISFLKKTLHNNMTMIAVCLFVIAFSVLRNYLELNFFNY